MDGGFSNAIHVDKLSTLVVVLLVPGFESDYLKCLPAKNHMPQLMWFLALSLRRNQLSKGTGCLVENRHVFPAYQPVKIFRRTRYVFGDDYQTTPIQQSPTKLPH